MSKKSPQLDLLAAQVSSSRQTVVFTGAGISTESGIPDFRSPNGIWAKYEPIYYDEFLSSADARLEYWRRKCESYEQFANAEPNIGHTLIAKWEVAGRVRAVITQNIDGLHQQAGSHEVLELHGTDRKVVCVECAELFAVEPLVQQFLLDQKVPKCPHCKGWLKHATISFGQTLPPAIFQRSAGFCKNADLVIAIGTSLVVEPAASLPRLAKQHGATLAILNRTETGLDELADIRLSGEIGSTLSALDAMLA